MKIKKIKPTPRSITHKNPTKISASSRSSHHPIKTKYSPAKYQIVIMLNVVVKYIKVTRSKICNTISSLNIVLINFNFSMRDDSTTGDWGLCA